MAENKRFSLEEIKKENVDLVSFLFFKCFRYIIWFCFGSCSVV
jgi:hypothetical protein